MCSGGGTSTTSQTVVQSGDPEAQRMAAQAAKDQTAMAKEQYERFMQIYAPYEEAAMASNKNLVPLNEKLTALQLQHETELAPLRANVEKLGLSQVAKDLIDSQPVKDALRKTQLQELSKSEEINNKFFDAATQGVNVKDRLEQASADVSQQFGTARAELSRTQTPFRRGNALGDLAAEEAKARVAAITGTRRGAEAENFSRLGVAKEALGKASGLAGTGDLSTTSVGALNPVSGQINSGNYQIGNPLSAAQGFYGEANQSVNTMAATGTNTSTSNGTQYTPGGGFGNVLGTVGGMALGAYTGGLGTMMAAQAFKK